MGRANGSSRGPGYSTSFSSSSSSSSSFSSLACSTIHWLLAAADADGTSWRARFRNSPTIDE